MRVLAPFCFAEPEKWHTTAVHGIQMMRLFILGGLCKGSLGEKTVKWGFEIGEKPGACEFHFFMPTAFAQRMRGEDKPPHLGDNRWPPFRGISSDAKDYQRFEAKAAA